MPPLHRLEVRDGTVDRHGGPSPGIDRRRKGKIRKGEDGAAVNKAEAVQVMIPEIEPRRCPACARLEKFDAHKPRKEILPEKGLQGFGAYIFVQECSSIPHHRWGYWARL